MAKGLVTLPIGFKRVDSEPLEADRLFVGIDSATTYASTDPTAYPGLIISVIEGNKTNVYVIGQEKQLIQLALLSGDQRSYEFSDAQSLHISHNLNKMPEVVLLNSTGQRCYPEIIYTDENNIEVQWNGVMSGKIYLI